jgi:enoyl-CoA hydratase/carnithine racemase
MSEPPAAQNTQIAGSPPRVDRMMEDAVAVLSMASAPYNLVDAELMRELIMALEWAADHHARAVVLRSSLRHFSAGADLDKMLADVDGTNTLDWGLTELLEAFENHRVPIIASVHGACVGGGFELALASDLVIAAASTKFGAVEATVGLHPLMGGIQRIAQRAGIARAKEMAMLARRYDAATLERWNVINMVVADEHLESATMTIAQELAHGPTVCHAATKRLCSVAVDEGVGAADDAMAELQHAIFGSEDFREGVRSFRERGAGMARFGGR